MPDDELRDRVRVSLEDVPVPSPDLEDVFRRARRREERHARFRYSGLVAAALILLAGIVLPLWPLLDLGESTGPRERADVAAPPTEQRLSVGGVQLPVPSGWDGHAYHIKGYTRPVLRIATFSLPEFDDIEANAARSRMQEGDILLSLTDYSAICPCPGFARVQGQRALTPEDFQAPFDVWNELPPQAEVVPESHGLARRTFVMNNRSMDLWVEFGRNPASQEQQEAVNPVLSSLVVGDYTPPMEPDGVCNEWSLQKDPDCPQTIWIKSVLSQAGFEVIDSPQEQTLVGAGDGSRFFIWVREPLVPLEQTSLRRHSVVEGVQLYGGSQLVWRAQEFNVWIAPGPRGPDRTPQGEELASLIRATIDVPYDPDA